MILTLRFQPFEEVKKVFGIQASSSLSSLFAFCFQHGVQGSFTYKTTFCTPKHKKSSKQSTVLKAKYKYNELMKHIFVSVH